MGKVTVVGGKVRMEAPVTGIQLSTIAEGSIVKLNENGLPVEFYVAKHDYESSLNGSGRTLLVRKDCYKSTTYGSSRDYQGSTLDKWCTGTYAGLLDSAVQNAIATTKIESADCSVSGATETIKRSVFVLSAKEYGVYKSTYVFAEEGETLPTADLLKIAYLNGEAIGHWTRSPYKTDTKNACCVWTNGTLSNAQASNTSCGYRPCFTLPSTALFDDKTLEFKGVA